MGLLINDTFKNAIENLPAVRVALSEAGLGDALALVDAVSGV